MDYEVKGYNSAIPGREDERKEEMAWIIAYLLPNDC